MKTAFDIALLEARAEAFREAARDLRQFVRWRIPQAKELGHRERVNEVYEAAKMLERKAKEIEAKKAP